MKHYYIFFVLLIGIISCPGILTADLVFYTDRNAWESAVTSDILVENFDAVEPFFLTEGINAAGLIDIELVNLSEVNKWNSINNGTDYDDILAIDGTPFYQGACRLTDLDTIINLNLPSDTPAFGADFTSTHSSSYGNGLTLLVNGIERNFEELLPMDDGTGFLGLISTDGSFSTVTLFAPDNNEAFGLDNVRFAIPEPAALGILGLGAVFLRKRRAL